MRVESSLRLSSLFSVLCVFLFSAAGWAQYSNVQGVVTDPSQAAIAGASVRLRNVDTGIEQTATTGDSGNYRFSSLPPGNYVLTVEANGFKKTQANFTLSTSETKGINLALGLAAAQQTINVEVTPPVVDTDDSRIEATLSADTVRDLPSANRNLWDVLAVTPGVVGAGVRAAGTSPGGGNDNFGTQTTFLVRGAGEPTIPLRLPEFVQFQSRWRGPVFRGRKFW